VNILENFSLGIYRNSILAILGHNGAGKTTVLRIIGKLIQPLQGTTQWNFSEDKKLNLMPEGLGLYP
jgi:ABC-type multidrug transport system ATPase subunit